MANKTNFILKIPLFLQLMRLHQPTGIWLLLWPCWWSITLSSASSYPDFYLLALFALGAIVMRGAGCVINDIIDREIDAKVARTKNRPLASGRLSLKEAFIFLAILLLIGLFIISQLNIFSIIAGFIFFIPVVIYPFMKRYIPWPQVVLGFTFNAGAIIGWTAVTGRIEEPAVLLYIGSLFWTIGYDTIYAHQDKKYDEQIGVKSTAVAMRDNTKIFVTLFYLLTIIFFTIAGSMVFQSHNIIFYSSMIIALAHLMWQVRTVNLDNPTDCMNKFRSNKYFGWIVFTGIIMEKMLNS